MAKVVVAKTNFTGGEVSPQALGRFDLQLWGKSGATLLNTRPTALGGSEGRPPTSLVGRPKYNDRRWRPISFRATTSAIYEIEAGHNYFRFWTPAGRVVKPLAVTAVDNDGTGKVRITVNAHGLSTGMGVVCTGIPNVPATTEWTITVVDANRFTLDGSVFTAPPGGAVTCLWFIEIATPYQESGLMALRVAQHVDRMWIVDGLNPPQLLRRLAADAFTIGAAEFKYGPFAPINQDRTHTMYASAETGGAITLTSSKAIFTANHVGALILLEQVSVGDVTAWEVGVPVAVTNRMRNNGVVYECVAIGGGTSNTGSVPPTHLRGDAWDGNGTNSAKWRYLHAGSAPARIVGVTSSTVATITPVNDEAILPQHVVGAPNATWRWALQDFGPHVGWPSQVSRWKNRLVLGGSPLGPDTNWLSAAGFYDDYAARDGGGKVVADRAITLTIDQPELAKIVGYSPTRDALLVNTELGEWTIGVIDVGRAFGADNAQTFNQSWHGAADMAPVVAAGATLFAVRGGERVREAAYRYEVDAVAAPDVSLIAEHLLKGGVVQLAWSARPVPTVWALHSNGELRAFSYEKDQQVMGWSRHILGGGAFVEAISVLASADGTADDVWLSVRRTVDGQPLRTIEKMGAPPDWAAPAADQFYLDASLSYNGPPVTTLSGLDHLKGLTVRALIDGAPSPPIVVSPAGSVTFEPAGSVVHVGLPFSQQFKTLPIEAGTLDGIAQPRPRRSTKIWLRLLASGGPKIGPREDTLYDLDLRKDADPMDAPVPLFTGDVPVDGAGWLERAAQIVIQHDLPTPLRILAIMARISAQDGEG